MSPVAKAALAAAGLAVVMLVIGVPLWLVALVLVAVPTTGYLMLDSSQRRRLRGVMGRRGISS